MSRHVLIAVFALVAIFLCASVWADIGELRDRLAGFHWIAFGAALLLAGTNYWLRFLRWQLYLRKQAIAVPWRLSFLIFFSGFALSVTPGKVGELIKSFLLRATQNVQITRSAPVVIAERFTDLIALLILGLCGVAMYGIAPNTVIAGFVLVLGLLTLVAWPPLGQWLISTVGRGPLRKFRDRLLAFYDQLKGLLHPRPLLWATPIAVVAWFAECIAFLLIVLAFPETHISWDVAVWIYATTTIAGALSFLPGGLIITEAGMTLLLVRIAHSVDHSTAVAATILTRLATLWFAVLLGLLALLVVRHRFPGVKRVLEKAQARQIS